MELLFLISWLLFGLIGGMIGSKKGQGCGGFVLGLILGPIGLIIALLTKGDRVTCPFCKELIATNSKRCPKCQADFSPPETSQAPILINGEVSLESETKKCPSCAEKIKLEAIKCRFCGHNFDPDEVKKQIEAKELEIKSKNDPKYIIIDKDDGDAFCNGCRSVVRKKGLYYNKETDSYYHKQCLPSA